MLILPDSSSLGDTHLSPEEGVAKLKEGNQKLSDSFRLPNQTLLTDEDASHGQMMSSNDFISKLRKIDSGIIVEDGGVPGAVAVRYPRTDEETGQLVKSYVTGFYKGPMSEWSLILEDKNGKPTRHMRGWRTVLLDLMRGNILSYAQVKAAFGDPRGSRSILWQEQTQVIRA